MSIFDNDFMNPVPYLQEKTLAALQAAARLVDLANEPDTTDWYKRNLLGIAAALIERLVPVVALLHGIGSEAAQQAEAIVKGGSFALSRWCKRWEIGDVSAINKVLSRDLRPREENEEKSVIAIHADFEGDIVEAQNLKIGIYNNMCMHLLKDEFPEVAKRMLLWMLRGLWLSEPPDIVHVSRRFLPTDIGVSREEAANAFQFLYDHGVIELVDEAKQGAEQRDALRLRLVAEGLNDSKSKLAFQDIEFGFEGARVNGKPCIGQTILLSLPKSMSTRIARWFKKEQEISELRSHLQETVGKDRIYVESTRLTTSEVGESMICIEFRHPIDCSDDDEKALETEIKSTTSAWIETRMEQVLSMSFGDC